MSHQALRRELGLGGAIVIGLGSILGTGAFVAIGVASARWTDAVVVAIPLAAAVAVFNGLSSSFLAGRFPVAGGTYEYGHRTLNPWLGFCAGWLFILAKTASAATAALGVGLYLGMEGPLVPIGAVLAVAVLVVAGVRRTAAGNAILVGLAIVALVWFSVAGFSGADTRGLIPVSDVDLPSTLAATAFLFVAYTGYGRIATLGEEVEHPERVIPRAVLVTLAVTALLYLATALGGRAMAGPDWGATVELARLDTPVVTVGAVTAMLGVLLNLILGLSRVWLAMGRRGDMPAGLAKLDTRSEPRVAILVSAVLVATITVIGDIAVAWGFSAMTVLLYYGITNLAALALDRKRVTAWLGLVSCVSLSVFVPAGVWLAGVVSIVAGLLWKTGFQRLDV